MSIIYITHLWMVRPGRPANIMKCPQCSVRNSVAATQCKDCGTKLPRKTVTLPGFNKTSTLTKLKAIEVPESVTETGDHVPLAVSQTGSHAPHTPLAVTQTGTHKALAPSVQYEEMPDLEPAAYSGNGNGNGNGNGHSESVYDDVSVAPLEIAPAKKKPIRMAMPLDLKATADKIPAQPQPQLPAVIEPEVFAEVVPDVVADVVPQVIPQAIPDVVTQTGSHSVASGEAVDALFATPGGAAGESRPGDFFPGLPKKRLGGGGGFSIKLPTSAKVGIGVVAALVVGVAGFSFVAPMFDPEVNLEKVVRKVAAGPKSGSDAEHIKAELESTVKEFLEKNSALSTPELTARLQKVFPNSAFETRVFDLPNNLRLVEIDTMLQATDYLMSNKHVAVLRNFEVFDTAKIVANGSESYVVLLGHRNAQVGHQPQVRVFSLQNGDVTDRTADTVPAISGDGSAQFATNGEDINLDLSLASKAGEEKLFTLDALSKGPLSDETVKSKLVFSRGKYTINEDRGTSQLACLRAAAFVLADNSAKDRFRRYFVDGVLGSTANFDKLKVNPPLFKIGQVASTGGTTSSGGGGRHSRRHHHDAPASNSNATVTYLLNNGQDAFEVTMGHNGLRYLVTGIKRVKASGAEGNQMVVEATEKPAKPEGPVEVTMKPSETPAGVPGKDDKVVTKTDEFGSQKIVAVVPAGENASKIIEKIKPTLPEGATAVVSPAPTAAAVAPAAVSSAPQAGHISDSPNITTVKVRKGASTGKRSIGELKRGESVQILAKEGDWYKIAYQGGEGYVFGPLVQMGAGSAAGASAAPAIAPTQAKVTAPVVATPPAATRNSDSGRKNKSHEAPAVSTPVASGKGSVVLKNKSVWDASSNHVGDIQPGQRVVILGTGSHRKYKVQLPNGRVGYVDKSAIDGGSGAGEDNMPHDQRGGDRLERTERSERSSERPSRRSKSSLSSHSSESSVETARPSSSSSVKAKKSTSNKAAKAPAAEAPPQFVP
jgi:uncharacterized protein YraI